MTALLPPRTAPHGDTEAARPTHVRVTEGRLLEDTTIGRVYPVLYWKEATGIHLQPVIRDDHGDTETMWPMEWEPAAPPAPIAADTARPHNPHGSLDFTSSPVPSAFDACLAVIRAFDDVSDETLAMVIADVRSDRPQMWIALQAARAALVAEGYR